VTLSAHEIREIAVEAKVDPRTVAKWLAGELCRPLHSTAIEAAITRLGYQPISPAKHARVPSRGRVTR